MAQRIRALAFLPGDLDQSSAPVLHGSQPPLAPASGDSTVSSILCGHLYSHVHIHSYAHVHAHTLHVHTHICIIHTYHEWEDI